MSGLSLGLGVQSLRRIKIGGAVPTQITVATTNTIIVTGTSVFNGTYTKQNATYYQSGGNSLSFDFTFGSPPQWNFFDGDATYEQADPPAFNVLFIARSFNATITLTAA
jgi:hypothetical protein